MLNRIPSQLPPLELLLADLGHPSPRAIARALHVSERTVHRWIREEQAPIPVMLALFWVTRWGVSSVNAEAINAAAMQSQLANAHAREVKELQERLRKLGKIADFGAANDPAPGVEQPKEEDRDTDPAPWDWRQNLKRAWE
jgi:Homeodomain-like domain